MARKRQSALIVLFTGIALTLSAAVPALANTIVRFHTVLGNIDVELFNNDTPLTVTNFLSYVTDPSDPYHNTFFHRSVPGFVLQGGGFTTDGTSLNVGSVPNIFREVATDGTVIDPGTVLNEASLTRPNVRGTIAMAKQGGNPDSASNQWFFNLVDNPDLDTQNGGFTVFGQVADQASLAVMDALAALPVFNANPGGDPNAGPFGSLPLHNFDPSVGLIAQNLVTVSDISVLHNPEPASFFMLTTLWVGLIGRRRSRAA